MTGVSIAALVAAARSGRWLVSFPTDTVPALAVRPDQAVRIYTAKLRRQDKPLILMGATFAALKPFIQGSAEEWHLWQQVATQYWPGALTLVLPASHQVPPEMHSTVDTIGLRVPNWPIAQTILQQTGPLATTSINLSGQPPLQALADIEQQFPDVLTLLPIDWTLPHPEATEIATTGTPSTVARWTGTGWEILRQGAIKLIV